MTSFMKARNSTRRRRLERRPMTLPAAASRAARFRICDRSGPIAPSHINRRQDSPCRRRANWCSSAHRRLSAASSPWTSALCRALLGVRRRDAPSSLPRRPSGLGGVALVTAQAVVSPGGENDQIDQYPADRVVEGSAREDGVGVVPPRMNKAACGESGIEPCQRAS